MTGTLKSLSLLRRISRFDMTANVKRFSAALLASFLLLSACKDLASPETVDLALQKNASACGIDVSSLDWSRASGRSTVMETRKRFAAKFSELKNLLVKKDIQWEVAFGEEIKPTCQLSKSIILASPGIVGLVDHLHWAFQSLLGREGLPVNIEKIRIVISGKKGTDLYESNRASVAYSDEKGRRSIDYSVNLGDLETGVSFYSLIRNLTSKDIVFQHPRALKKRPVSAAR
jgi:hypothetical protein